VWTRKPRSPPAAANTPEQRAAPGRAARREFEYVRHGTISIQFLTTLDQHTDPNLTIHLVLDNGSSHTSKATKKWLREHPRFQPHYTPAHASWLDQAELFFSILTRRLLRRGEFTSREDLASRIENFVIVYNRTAKPYRWTYEGRHSKLPDVKGG
jgi:transposase